MLLKLNKYFYLAVALVFFTVAVFVENSLLRKHPEKHLVNEFKVQMLSNEKILKNNIEKIAEIVNDEAFEENYFESLKDFNLLVDKTGYGYLVYKSGELKYWSDRAIAFYGHINDYKKHSRLLQLPNGYYLSADTVIGDNEIIGVQLIKYNYKHENKYLQNNFYRDYNLPREYEVTASEKENGFQVTDISGNYLFSIVPWGNYLCTKNQLYFPGVIYFLGLLILLFYFRKEFIENKAPFLLRLFGLGMALFIIYWLHLIFNIPAIVKYLPVFNPRFFAFSDWLPSLGGYFLIALFFAFWLYNFTLDLNISELTKDSGLSKNMIVALLLLFSASIYLLVHFFIEILVINSAISFSLSKITSITLQSVLGIFSVGLMLLFTVVFTLKIIRNACGQCKKPTMVIMVIAIVVFLAITQLIVIKHITWFTLFFFCITALLEILFGHNYLKKYALGSLIIFVSVASIYSLMVIYQNIGKKERETQKVFAIKLVNERDPAAEEFLSKIQVKMKDDPAILSLIAQNREWKDYIERAYFNSYFRKYLIDIYICGESDSVTLLPSNQKVPCNPYINGLIRDMGINIPGTDFYFMDNLNGRISYTGQFHYPLLNDSAGLTLFIDLDSDLLFEGIGFPELLIDKSITRSDNFRKFNYAKYYGGELTDKFGDYNYNYYIDTYGPADQEFTYRKWDKLEHLIYHTRENNYVIVSRNLLTFNEYLISFPYIFVFYFVSLLLLMLVGDQNLRKHKIVIDLKFKIQAAIISIVFVSLLLVASATIYYNVEEYKLRYRNDLEDKMTSIAEEIDMRLNERDDITPDVVNWLVEELSKLSNIFQTDINIYGINGSILASSRPEIFQRGLVSSRINSQAYYEIFQNFQFNNYIQHEKIGKLSYFSIYKPIINQRGVFLGAINLPYFIKQDKYSQEISTLVVAFINLYVLLFLASIIVAVFIANQITHPLTLLQANLQKITLGKRSEPINYNRNDEIGSLVKEYNKKVDELAVSAELLARSERESAWREMAKQIAHEIKNPLTPMKLNIQHLQRTKVKNKEYNESLERITATLIEQIDNLSDIATEFSNFAKIPQARNQVFVLAEQLQKVIDLYETHNRAHIVFRPENYKTLRVNADREQLSRAVINLIKNGIQAIPEEREGIVTISLDRREHMAVVSVADNGTGIPEEVKNKLFSPSFTTKTSGMGLGLSIVKNIVENFSGKIWFETASGKGTTFFFEIPIYEEETNETQH